MKEGGYNQFCPVAKGAAVLGERWTILIIREMLTGATRFSDFQKSLPKASPAIIVTRLQQLEAAAILTRREDEPGARPTYHLTPAGLALRPVLIALGEWSSEWIRTRLRDDEIDEYLLMKDVQRRIQVDHLPESTAVIRFRLRGPASRRLWWLIVDEDNVDLCDTDPTVEPDLYVDTHVRTLVEVWLGKRDLEKALSSGKIRLSGERRLRDSINRWFGYSLFAKTSAGGA